MSHGPTAFFDELQGYFHRATNERSERAEPDPDQDRDGPYFDRLDAIAKKLVLAVTCKDAEASRAFAKEALALARLEDVPEVVITTKREG